MKISVGLIKKLPLMQRSGKNSFRNEKSIRPGQMLYLPPTQTSSNTIKNTDYTWCNSNFQAQTWSHKRLKTWKQAQPETLCPRWLCGRNRSQLPGNRVGRTQRFPGKSQHPDPSGSAPMHGCPFLALVRVHGDQHWRPEWSAATL